jgi:polyisoprenyl-teichoic acid--peptidoglycan teichoic acid transferase
MVAPKDPGSPAVKWTRRGPALPAAASEPSGKKRGHRPALYVFLVIALGTAAAATYIHLRPASAPNTVADGLSADRINIVLIGVGGDSHPGGGKDLADAIMVLSLKPSTKQAAMISIPRDYYIALGGRGKHRINAAHALGGPALVMDAAHAVLGQPMHAFVRIDFAAFEKIIDEIGGVDIYVQRAFYDFLFKDGFQQGWQHMNGRRALRFARYRYVDSEEGNNYARELRQQQVLAALRAKLTSLSPQQALRLIAVAQTVSEHTSTNLTARQIATLYSTFRNMEKDHIRHVSLAPFTRLIPTHDLADPTPAVGPRAGDNRQIQLMARDVFAHTEPIVTESQIRPGTEENPSRVTMTATGGPQ